MNYFKLSYACATKETGSVYPQIQRMSDNYNSNSNTSIYALGKHYQSFPDFEPDLTSFVLHGRARFSDFISNGIIGLTGLIISEKAKNIFENSHLTGYKFYPAKILYRKVSFDYYWMHYISNIRECVNYKKSKFYVTRNFMKKLDYIDIDSEEDIVQKSKLLNENSQDGSLFILAEEINLNSSFDSELDFFKVGKFDSDYYVSERLRNIFEKYKTTGIEFSEANNICFSSK